jgi:hypothetical protein
MRTFSTTSSSSSRQRSRTPIVFWNDTQRRVEALDEKGVEPVPTTKEILSEIVARRRIESPDARPLYAYRAESEAIVALYDALERVFASHGFHIPRDSAVCAGFCLFAAERFCRSYTGGGWKWEAVSEPLRLVADRWRY